MGYAKALLVTPSVRLKRRRTRACGRAALVRIVKLHRRLSAGEPVSAVSLARDLEVSDRTIKRDIETMRDQMEVPIEWNAATGTYYYTRHCDLLPLLRLDAAEALALALAGRTFAAWRGSPLGAALTAALEKIAPVVRGAVSLPIAGLEELLFAPEDPTADAEHGHFATLLEAIQRRRELKLEYQKPTAGARVEVRTVHPLHLAYLEHRWIVIAHDPARGALRNFLLARIRSLRATGEDFVPPAGFEAHAYLRGSVGRFTGAGEHVVRIAFDAVAAPYIRERPWHATQEITAGAEGSIEVTLRLNNLIDIERRVLACGAHAEVLAPEELRASIRAAAAAMLRCHAPAERTWQAAEGK